MKHMVPPASAATLTAAIADGPAALFRLVWAEVQAVEGTRAATLLAVAPDHTVVHRIATSDPAVFPIGGFDPVDDGPWCTRLLREREPLVANSPGEMRAFIPETNDLVARGLPALVCLPLIIAGDVAGVFCVLAGESVFTPEAVDRITALLPLAALIFAVPGITTTKSNR